MKSQGKADNSFISRSHALPFCICAVCARHGKPYCALGPNDPHYASCRAFVFAADFPHFCHSTVLCLPSKGGCLPLAYPMLTPSQYCAYPDMDLTFPAVLALNRAAFAFKKGGVCPLLPPCFPRLGSALNPTQPMVFAALLCLAYVNYLMG